MQSAKKPKFLLFTPLFWVAGLILFSQSGLWANTTLKKIYPDEAVTGNNLGVAQMGKFDFQSAVLQFESMVKQYPDISELRLNLAIATLNRQGEGDEQKALSILQDVQSREPDHPKILYCIGLLELRAGRPEAALRIFQKILQIDSLDPDLHYFFGKTLMQLSRYEDALLSFEKVRQLDPYAQSAIYGQMMALRQLNKIKEAQEAILVFQKMKNNPRARLTEFKYTRMGKLAEVVFFGEKTDRKTPLPIGSLFESPIAIKTDLPSQGSVPSMTTCDFNGDHIQDLFLVYNDKTALLFGRKDGGFDLSQANPFQSLKGINAALWGDINDDGFLDVYFLCEGSNQMWLQNTKGEWQNQTEVSHTAGGAAKSVDGALFDADHDGDLDIFIVNADAPNELLNNDRNGSFRSLPGFTGSPHASHRVCVSDIDSDSDVDIVVLKKNAPHEVFVNNLLWDYSRSSAWSPLETSDIMALAIADSNADGTNEIFTLDSNNRIKQWTMNSNHVLEVHPLDYQSTQDFSISNIALADVNGDLQPEILAFGKQGLLTLGLTGNKLVPLETHIQANQNSWLLISGLKGPEILGWAEKDGLVHCKAGPGRYPFMLLSLKGIADPENSFRTNSSGIGTHLALRIGGQWSVESTYKSRSSAGQSLQPLALGTAGNKIIDFIRIEWPDGVLQTETALQAGETHEILEHQRQLSSCPLIFGWDGKEFRFVSDFLGVGGMGYSIGKGEYATPRPWENFMFPQGILKEEGNKIRIILAEPMEEAAYLDSVNLKAYDLPPEWNMTLDERMGILGPEVTGQPVYYRDKMLLLKAKNERGQDVTELLEKIDLKPAPPGKLDSRFIGMLESDHVLELTFNDAMNDHAGSPVLVADSWVEYPYSQTNFAAWQAGATYRAPSIQYRQEDGSWTMLLEQFGYPAGMPRQMSVPLAGLPNEARELRLFSNQEIYWDRIIIAFKTDCDQVRINTCSLSKANLEFIGFPERETHFPRIPDYNFKKRSPLWDAKVQEGDYTELGDARALLAEEDGALAIFGPGEGISLEFLAPEKALEEGWTRVFVLETHGWCKDMDRFTQNGQTLEPIPGSELRTGASQALHNLHQRRYLNGQR